MYECINCSFKGEKLSRREEGAMYNGKCPVCGDEVKEIQGSNPDKEPLLSKDLKDEESLKKEELKLDLNNDGQIDKKDATIAAKVFNATKKKRK